MKATSILLFAVCLQIHAAAWSQSVSFTGKDVPLEQVFASVKKQTGFGFFYKAEILQNVHKVTIDVKNVSLEDFLDICLRDEPLSYKVVGQTVFITKKEEPHSASDLSGGPGSEIKGRVTNTHGEPLVNANIVVKRTGRGTVTNANGEFILRSVQPQDLVTVSFIGYKSISLPVKGRTSLLMVLDPATNDLDKVVVQAYGTTSQRLTTGDIGVVRAEDIAKQPVMNVLQAVQGQVAGVVVTNTSGYASGTVKVEIRGRNTLNSNFPSDPLYIIDGVPLTILDLNGTDSYLRGSSGVIQSGLLSPANGQSPFFSINPADIESIEILKDADATAIYGSRGDNGVILITTKKGKAGKTRLEMNIYSGISKNPRYYHLLNTPQYIAMRKEALANDGLAPDVNTAYDIVGWDTTRYTDWQRYMWGGTGKTIDAQAGLSGGTERTTFRIGAGYRRQTEILTANGANQRGSMSFNLNHKSINQRFNLTFSANYSVASSDMIYVPGSINLPPNGPAVFDKTGNLNYTEWDPGFGTSPFSSLLQPYSTKSNFLNSNLDFKYEFLKGLTFRTNFGYDNINTDQSFKNPIACQDPASNPTGSVYFGYSMVHNLIIEPQMEINKYLYKGKLNFLAGASVQNNQTSSVLINGFNYTNDALLNSVGNAPNQSANNSLAEYKYSAVFGRLNYNLENKYILNFNFRRDGSSRFGPGRQFGNFGSVGGAWIFSEENWIKKNLSFLSFGKLRSSYGATGGDQIIDYQYLTRWQYTPFQYNNSLPLISLGHTDSTLHWQVNKKLEIAINLGLAKDRVTVEAAWYRNRCNDQLIYFPTPSFTGFSSVVSNSAANVQNQGWEFTLTGKILDNSDFKWSARFNIGLNRNKLLTYPNLSQSPYADIYVVGKSINIVKKLHLTGVDPKTGYYTFQDINKDGQITIDYTDQTSDDRRVINLDPKYDGRFSTDFTYKDWQLSIFFYFKNQMGRNAIASSDIPGDNTNQPTNVLNRWQKPGDIAQYAKFTTSPSDQSYYNYLGSSDAIISNASFIRLQNLSFAYTLPNKTAKKIGAENIRLYIQGENIFTITKYNGLDPEVLNFGSLPRPRVMTLGISCNF